MCYQIALNIRADRHLYGHLKIYSSRACVRVVLFSCGQVHWLAVRFPVYILKEGYFNCTKPTSTQPDLSESQIFITGLVTFCLKLGA